MGLLRSERLPSTMPSLISMVYASATIVGEQSYDAQGEEYMTYNVDVVIPICCCLTRPPGP